jgi:hypothetical protein
MAIAVNKNTTQATMQNAAGAVVAGRSGTQSIKWIPAPRVYVKTSDATVSSPVQSYFTKSNGVTPTGWTDLGSVLGSAKVAYSQKVKEVSTGMDSYFRGAYVDSKIGQVEFNLSQLDDVVLEQITGLSASVITSGSIINYQIGQLDLNQMALLLVVQNKFDSKEWQFYNPNAFLNFAFEEQGDALSLKVTGYLPFFTAAGALGTKEGMLSATVFA